MELSKNSETSQSRYDAFSSRWFLRVGAEGSLGPQLLLLLEGGRVYRRWGLAERKGPG